MAFPFWMGDWAGDDSMALTVASPYYGAGFPDAPFGRVHLHSQAGPLNSNGQVKIRGRRNRVLAALSRYATEKQGDEVTHHHWFASHDGDYSGEFTFQSDHRLTFAEVFELLKGDNVHAEVMRLGNLGSVPLRTLQATDQKFAAIPEDYVLEKTSSQVDPQLHCALHDIALMIRRDLRDAIQASLNDGWYAGVDSGIEPVTDEHVRLVIWATQRELTREIRRGKPPAQLAEMPWRIQRAFAERRRLRYQEWGIGFREWDTNEWSVWNVPDDDWLPEWAEKEASA